jgi:hypothetical protein
LLKNLTKLTSASGVLKIYLRRKMPRDKTGKSVAKAAAAMDKSRSSIYCSQYSLESRYRRSFATAYLAYANWYVKMIKNNSKIPSKSL